jgi:hypothetical protein
VGYGSGAEVVNLRSHEQQRESLALGLEGDQPGWVVDDDLDRCVTTPGSREILGCCSATVGWRHLRGHHRVN